VCVCERESNSSAVGVGEVRFVSRLCDVEDNSVRS